MKPNLVTACIYSGTRALVRKLHMMWYSCFLCNTVVLFKLMCFYHDIYIHFPLLWGGKNQVAETYTEFKPLQAVVYSFRDLKTRRKLLKLCTLATFISNNNTVYPYTSKTNKLWLKYIFQTVLMWRQRWKILFHSWLFAPMVHLSQQHFFVCTLICHFKFAGLKLSATSSVLAFFLTRLNVFQKPFFPLCTYVLYFKCSWNNFLINETLSSLSQCTVLTALRFSSSFIFTF